ncbi:hypothetical protein KUL25_03535 [Rhodobacteraceae bacterium N5(2021)]|uniref:Uncharacterized protein n=1 Tax=Gymnodinialimonas phycosphaerae TaxID=2841589 RepID=A0A975TWA8_9RHOB|nr:hypothetical protein [Gymnodinialimonas phycosphaerae]MBY4891831.1 hypothetical protein [Gymnodinialimonas phycosphaerae]
MSDMKKTTENSKVELTDDELDGVQGGYTAADGAHKGGTPLRGGIMKEHDVKGYTENDSKGKGGKSFQDGSDLRIGASKESFLKR